MDDERVRERVRPADTVGGERDDGRPLEHTEGCRTRRKDQREPGRDDGQEAGGGPEPEVEAEHDEPERHRQEEPGEKRPEEGDEAETRASQPDEAVHQVPRERLDPLRQEERQTRERTQREPERALAEDPEDDDSAHQDEQERDRQRAGDVQPGHFREPGKPDEEEQEQREDVEEPLDHDRARRFRPRPAPKSVQREDASRVAGSEREDVVEELADEEGLRRGPERGPRTRGEEQLPAERANEEGKGEQRERGNEPPVVAPAKRLGELVELDVAHRDVGESDADDDREGRIAVPGAAQVAHSRHRRRSDATQARLYSVNVLFPQLSHLAGRRCAAGTWSAWSSRRTSPVKGARLRQGRPLGVFRTSR